MRATITKPTAVAEFDTSARDREDREQPGPVAEARDELRAEQREEPGTRKTRHGAGGIGSWSGAGGMNGACVAHELGSA